MSQIAKTTIESAVKGNVGTRMGRLAKRIVKPSSSSKTSTNDALATFAPASSSQKRNSEYHFLEYATDHWFKHTTHLSSKRNAAIWALLGQTIRKPPELSCGEGWHDWIMIEESVMNAQSYAEIDYFMGGRYLVSVKRLLGGLPVASRVTGIAFLYATSTRNWGLSCRTFQLLAEIYRTRTPPDRQGLDLVTITQQVLCIIAANKEHECCVNQCLNFVRQDLNHEDFVREIARGIARGIPFLPPLEVNGTKELCKCANTQGHVLQQDFCNILTTGYRRDEERHIQAFAYLACGLQFNAPVPLSRLSETCQLEASVLLSARTASGKSLLDVLVRKFMSDWMTFESRQVLANIPELVGRRIEIFFCIQFKAEAIPELESPFLDVQADGLLDVLAVTDRS
jgi:hypothetical protein